MPNPVPHIVRAGNARRRSFTAALASWALLAGTAAAQPPTAPQSGADIPGRLDQANVTTGVRITAPGVSGGLNGGTVPWATLSRPFDGLHIDLGNSPVTSWPGGGAYGSVSAITGSLVVPPAADADLASPGVSRLIVNAGLSGLARTYSTVAPAVGVYASGSFGREGGQGWGLNVTAGNYTSSAPGGSPGFNGLVYGIEGDVGLHRPANGWGGTNVDGIWMPLDAPSQPDGELNMLHVGVVGAARWKNAVKIDGGAADYAREVGPATPGPGPSLGTPDHYLLRDSTGRVRHILTGFDTDGRWYLRPILPGGSGDGTGLRIQSATGGDVITLDGSTGLARVPTLVAGSVTATAALGTAGHLVSVGPRPTLRACAGGTLSDAATDLRGRVTLPPGLTRCTVVLAAPGATAPDVVVSGSVPGVAPAVTGHEGTAAFTVGLPPGIGTPVTVTWLAVQ